MRSPATVLAMGLHVRYVICGLWFPIIRQTIHISQARKRGRGGIHLSTSTQPESGFVVHAARLRGTLLTPPSALQSQR